MTLLLDLQHITYKEGEDEALLDISFSLNEGENVLFFGLERSGLNSIPHLILNLDDNFQGDILYKGNKIKELDYYGRIRYKNEIGYIHGYYGLISNMSVEDNIALPMLYHTEYTSDRIQEMVDIQLHEFNLVRCRKMRPVELSPSEIMRTAYARSIIKDPDLLIIDHALVDQVPLNIISILKNLKNRAGNPGKSVLFVTYEPEKLVDHVDVFVMFYKGRIVFSGTGDDFLNSENSYLKQFREIYSEGPMTVY